MNAKRNLLKNNGFTIVEMAGVLIVMGILLAIAVPSVSHFMRGVRLSGTSNELMANIHYARSLATSKRTTYHIEFQASQYSIVETATSEVVRTLTFPPGVTCSATADPSFYPWGLVDPVVITLDGGVREVDVNVSANGRVSTY
jgi:prepilin-type N-terminal cleavage/methylation domain-containing protein